MQNARRIISALSVALVTFLVVLSCSDNNSNPGSPDISEGRADSLQSVLDSLFRLSGYAGSRECGKCHDTIYNRFSNSAHAAAMRPVSGVAPKYPYSAVSRWPESVANWGEIAFVVGGYDQGAMFIDTAGKVVDGPNNYYSLAGDDFSTVNGPGLENNCGKCHGTAWGVSQLEQNTSDTTSGDEAAVEGKAMIFMSGVECESCHGPGLNHVRGDNKLGNIRIDTRRKACLSCHVSMDSDKDTTYAIPDHNTQHPDTTGYQSLDCVYCHSNPHLVGINPSDTANLYP